MFQLRDVAQLVEYASGGREVAGSSPVIPTLKTQLLNFKAIVSSFFSNFGFEPNFEPNRIGKLKLKPLKENEEKRKEEKKKEEKRKD